MTGRVRIGTSGWHYQHWKGPFYPTDLPTAEMLGHYAQHFDTVEINNTFYRLPTTHAVDGWRAATPKGFLFAVKGSRYLTHMKKLKDPEEGLARFLPAIEGLGRKLGPILFQLPGGWRADAARLADFLGALPARHRYSFEFRDPSWHVPAIYRLLERHDAAFCIYDLVGTECPLRITADFTYVRFHGFGQLYGGRYPIESLRTWARRIARWRRCTREIDVYFNNDQAGYAVENARQLKDLLA